MKAATISKYSPLSAVGFQSTPPVKAATFAPSVKFSKVTCISIHAAREGGDLTAQAVPAANAISIHAAREGGDSADRCGGGCKRAFQSTPPVKAATSTYYFDCPSVVFQSTPPVKAATVPADEGSFCVNISIHAAREGGDFTTAQAKATCCRFQSTPPVKAATLRRDFRRTEQEFQSTPPVKAATDAAGVLSDAFDISIHAAREGGDTPRLCYPAKKLYFNPRRP